MNDEEIIKALECCTEDEDCTHCPSIKEMPYCSNNIMTGALNLIKRQQAEIDRLKSMNQAKLDTIHDLQAEIEKLKNEIQITKDAYIMLQTKNEIIKSEAVKEFENRLKNKIKIECNPYCKPTCDYGTGIEIMRYIDNLVKEMVDSEKENLKR